MATFTGRKWHFNNPLPEDVDIKDIAHALSMICRFGGHCREFYSVAQHSCWVASSLGIHFQPTEGEFSKEQLQCILWGLMHDATEAYVGDMVRPIKLGMPDYRALEGLTEEVIIKRFDLVVTPDTRKLVKHFDDVQLMTERRDLVNHCGHDWSPLAEPMEMKLRPLSPERAELHFLKMFEAFTRDLQEGSAS